MPEPSATTSELIRLLTERDANGRAKYGTTLDRTDLTHADWLQHMVEELLDAAGYALAAKREAKREIDRSIDECIETAKNFMKSAEMTSDLLSSFHRIRYEKAKISAENERLRDALKHYALGGYGAKARAALKGHDDD